MTLRIQRPPLSLAVLANLSIPLCFIMQIKSASLTRTGWLVITGPQSIDKSSMTLKSQEKMYGPDHPDYASLLQDLRDLGLLS